MSAKHQPNLGRAGGDAPTALEVIDLVSTKGSCCSGIAITAPAPGQGDDMTECPVMVGTPVNKAHAEAAGLYRDHDGQRYWFCCASCAPTWDADPDEYATA